jgi:hypothetical protein
MTIADKKVSDATTTHFLCMIFRRYASSFDASRSIFYFAVPAFRKFIRLRRGIFAYYAG